MRNDVIKRSLAKFFFGACVLMAPCGMDAAMSAPADECAKELLLSYFPAPIVKETLAKFDVPQDKWDGITKSLANKDKEVVKLVEHKAAEMNPNPLKDPQQRQAAVKLFRETLMQVFSDALKENNFTDTSKYQAMLDDIQQQKAKKFAMCMEKQKQKAEELDKAANGAPNDENDNDNDENADEDEDENDHDMNDEDEDDEEDEDEDEEEQPNNNGNAASPSDNMKKPSKP